MRTSAPTAELVFSEFVRRVQAQPGAWRAYPRKKSDWTPVALTALVDTGHELYPNAGDHAARGHLSSHYRSEHLALDVTIYESHLGLLRFAAEHENEAKIDVLRYQCWKLLCTHADTRVLVGYWRARGRSGCKSVENVAEALKELVSRHQRGSITLILGDYDRTPSSNAELIGAFHYRDISP
jgi:hypothetical protein